MEHQIPFRSEALDHRYGQHRNDIDPVRLTRGVVLAAAATLGCALLLLVWLNTWQVSLAGRPPQTLLAWLLQQVFGVSAA